MIAVPEKLDVPTLEHLLTIWQSQLKAVEREVAMFSGRVKELQAMVEYLHSLKDKCEAAKGDIPKIG